MQPQHTTHPISATTHLHNGVFTIPNIHSPATLIGSGSYGKVYAGVQRLLVAERSVAIKLHEDPFLLDREVKVYRYLWTHIKKGYAPTLRIPRLLWDGHTDDQRQRALVMERLGDSLDKLFDRDNKRWSSKTVCWVACEAIRLLQGLHTLGILHRDIKPDNIMLGRFGETLVVDWGLALAINRDDTARACGEESLMPAGGSGSSSGSTGGAVGTPAYMSPEQAAGLPKLTPSADIFSLGATLYKLLTGQAPYRGDSARETLARAQAATWVPPQSSVE